MVILGLPLIPSHTVSNDTGTATWSTATSPGSFTAGIASQFR